MRAEILSIGTELLIGSIVNTNARFLSEALAERGVDVYHQTTVGDNIPRIASALKTALSRADLIICSGGLGPTDDDVTLEAVSRALGLRRRYHQPTASHIRQRLRQARLPVSKMSFNQCHLPGPALILQNQYGTAPAVLCETASGGEKRWVLMLPGPPKELQPLFRLAWPHIRKASPSFMDSFFIRTLKLTGLTEVQVAEKIGNLLRAKPPLTCGIYAKSGEVQLKIMSKSPSRTRARSAAMRLEKKLRAIFGKQIFGIDEETLPEIVFKLLRRSRQTVAFAESCTGGLLSHQLTEIPGSSAVFPGSVVSYADAAKTDILGVPKAVLKRHGAVSAPTALLMALGARKHLGASIGISVTGIAGPSGATRGKPVGLVFIALCDGRTKKIHRLLLTGRRTDIQHKSARAAFNLLRLHLLKSS